jgi:AcrR family transcriptional regulator
MPSQKSIAVATAREPKRERGMQRVAAILDAGAAVFAEKGYDAATMTEVAARSNTAIGSLYRFFPTKEVLADVLLARYGERIHASLDAITADAADLDAAHLADRLVDLMSTLRSDRAAAIALMDARGDADGRRSRLRADMRASLVGILAVAGKVPPAQGARVASTLLSQMRSVGPLIDEEAAGLPGLLNELRTMLQCYLAHVFDTAGAKRKP